MTAEETAETCRECSGCGVAWDIEIEGDTTWTAHTFLLARDAAAGEA